jgi:hypothetical protein
LNWDIVDAMSTVKELMLSPEGIVFEPLEVVVDDDDEDDDEQPAAAKATAARLTRPTRRRRRNVPSSCEWAYLLLPSLIPQTPFARNHPDKSTQDTVQHVCPFVKEARSLDPGRKLDR